MRLNSFVLALIFAVSVVASSPSQAQTETSSAQVVWRLLDYVSVDYAGAVKDGKVISPAEYSEMNEFAGQVRTRLAALPPTAGQAKLQADAQALEAAIARKASPEEVARQAHALNTALLISYPTPLAPSTVPDLPRGAQLFQENCAICHGATGRADTPEALALDPPPIAFADLDRARERSVFGLYQVIHQGLDGTAMASFAELPTADQWALAFYVGRFAFTDEQAARGEQLWNSDASLRQRLPNMQALVQITPAQLAAQIGDEKALALTAYLRRHPEAIAPKAGAATLGIARTHLNESLAAYRAGDRKTATDLALAAYLDGFEPVEPLLTARDPALMRRVEGAMGELRASIGRGDPVDQVSSKVAGMVALLDAAERALSDQKADAGASFAGAFTILIREGLEALLIVVAMLVFLRKADRKDVLPYVHGGWIAALAAGGLTWVAATYLISISGASRELTEGFGSVIAALVLLSVGLWMHGKSQADAWQVYIRDKLSKALSKRSAWFLFLLAFLVVYREVFETILFFAALWGQGSRAGMAAGAGAAVAVLAVIAWALLAYGKRLPISRFFALSSGLMAILAVVLIGKGVSAIQEAGLLPITPLSGWPRVEILGIYPTIEGMAAQAVMVALIGIGFAMANRATPKSPKPQLAE